VVGIFLPIQASLYSEGNMGHAVGTYLDAMSVRKEVPGADQENSSAILKAIDCTAQAPDPYSHLAHSIAPEIYGNEDVKKALLLQMIGGVSKTLADGLRIRGDIHVCLMGDPGVAKSQLLKYVAALSPRGIYSTGKGSSGVGLTACITRDAVTSEISLESGALVLADCGICCFPADDHQLLTNHGFMLLDDVLKCQDPGLQFASYVPKLKQLVYEHPVRVIVKAAGVAKDVVEITDHLERFRWSKDTTNPYNASDTRRASTKRNRHFEAFKTKQEVHPELEDYFPQQQLLDSDFDELLEQNYDKDNDVECATLRRSTRVSIVATANHEIYAMPCRVRRHEIQDAARFRKYKATNLAMLEKEACFKLEAHAEEGAYVPVESETTKFTAALFDGLGLDTEEKVIAFLEIYGCWLGGGDLQFRSSGVPYCVEFLQMKPCQHNFLLERLRVCDVDNEFYSCLPYDDGKCWQRIRVFEPRWLPLFFGEYWTKHESANELAIRLPRSKSNDSLVSGLRRRPQLVAADETEEDESKQRLRSFEILAVICDIPMYHVDDEKAHSHQHEARMYLKTTSPSILYSAYRPVVQVSDADMAFWHSRARTELPPGAFSAMELDKLLRRALSTSPMTRTSVLDQIRSSYIDRGAQECLLGFFSIVVNTAHLPFLRADRVVFEPRTADVCTRNWGKTKQQQFSDLDNFMLALLGEEDYRRVRTAVRTGACHPNDSDFNAAKKMLTNRLTSNGFGRPFPTFVFVAMAHFLRSTPGAVNPRTCVYQHLRDVFTPEFAQPTAKSYALDHEAAREALLLKVPLRCITADTPLKGQLKTEGNIRMTNSAKWLFWWVFMLEKTRARAILRGHSSVNGSEGNVVYTTSPKFRDELVILSLHAGYSARFDLHHPKETMTNPYIIHDGRKSITNTNQYSWAVTYATDDTEDQASGDQKSTAATPTMRRATDVHRSRSSGSMWCVTLPSTFVVVRRVKKVNGAVIWASLPTIQSNCIDEFDKLDESDRIALHEVMEQQRVSVAKAGITTALNARCAILAAANPLFGRYSKTHSIAQNVNLPHSLVSRFDLLFLILDTPEVTADVMLAQHITHVHRFHRDPQSGVAPLNRMFIRQYIAHARQFDPAIPPQLMEAIVETYVDRRQEDSAQEQPAMTARQLLSIMRLSQALARLRFDDSVNQEDVDEALRLTSTSQVRL